MDIDNTALDVLIDLALDEDLSIRGDVTSQALIDTDKTFGVHFVSRTNGVLSGVELVQRTFQHIDPSLEMIWKFSDGDEIERGSSIVEISGNYRSILKGERTALNFLQHLCGIASMTSLFVKLLQESNSTTIIRDTRKTLPGYRRYEKEAVVHGGGQNHRMGLYDAFLVKDNHIALSDLDTISRRCREFDPTLPLEIEVDTLEQLNTVVQFNPDIILLDNFSVDDVYRAIELANGIDLEISGGITKDNVVEYGKTNVKYIAIGTITHSAGILDIGCDAL